MKIFLLILTLLGLQSCASTPDSARTDIKIQKYWPSLPDRPRYEYVMSFYSTEDFVRKSEEEKMREFIVGKSQPQYIFKRPLDITSSEGRLYLLDSEAPAVHVFDLVRRKYFKFGYRFEGKLVNPVSIATDKNGRVFVADRGRNSIIIFDSIGLYQSLINLRGITTQLAGLVTDPEGEIIYVVDRGGIDSEAHQVVKLTRKGEVIKRIGTRGKEPGQLNLPMDIAMGTDDLLYVMDTGNFRVQVMDMEGNPVRHWGSAGNALGQFGLPRSISLDQENNVYVSDAQFGNVQVFSSEGQLLLPLGRLSQQDLPGQFSLTTGLTVDSRNYLYILDQYMKKMEVYKKLSPAEQEQIYSSMNQEKP
jgi:DNA-binding beta-propeller fold protein YncE